jgi:hypothetical protein
VAANVMIESVIDIVVTGGVVSSAAHMHVGDRNVTRYAAKNNVLIFLKIIVKNPLLSVFVRLSTK